MVVLVTARPHAAPPASRDGRGCGCAALFSRTQRRSSSLLSQSPLSAGPGSGRRHYPEEFAQTAELGVDHFDKRSAAEVERDFPAMVRAGSPLHSNDDATAHQLPIGAELFALDLGPTSGRRVRPAVASPEYEPHWRDAMR